MKLPKPPPDDGTRSEYEAFLSGFALALYGIKRTFPGFDTSGIEKSAIEAATELYPPFDPLPPPAKRSDDVNRRDGVIMSED